jgi:hypothetical protein
LWPGRWKNCRLRCIYQVFNGKDKGVSEDMLVPTVERRELENFDGQLIEEAKKEDGML